MRERIKADVKSAMLAGDKFKVTVLRGLLAAIQSVQIDSKDELTEDQQVGVLQKESKKRTEAAIMYEKGGSEERKELELKEKQIIEEYLPEQLSDEELQVIIAKVISEKNVSSMQEMGSVIGSVKQEAGPSADGAKIAQLVKERLSQ